MKQSQPSKRQSKHTQDLRIRNATPEALTKTLFSGAKPRPETKSKQNALKTDNNCSVTHVYNPLAITHAETQVFF